MARKRRTFTKEFKLETVKRVKEGTRTISQISQDLDLTDFAYANGCVSTTLMQGNDLEPPQPSGMSSSGYGQRIGSYAWNAKCQKKAAAFFAGESL